MEIREWRKTGALWQLSLRNLKEQNIVLAIKEVNRIALPHHLDGGEFNHAAVDELSDLLYVAHPSTDSFEVIDLNANEFLYSITGHKGVAGIWVSARRILLFTSNREDAARVFHLDGKKPQRNFAPLLGSGQMAWHLMKEETSLWLQVLGMQKRAMPLHL
jgi:hypothetical protein